MKERLRNVDSWKNGYTKIQSSFVKECDVEFDRKLAEAVRCFDVKRDIRIIGLTGPTCSGKTTAAKKLIEHLGNEQRRVCTVSLDDFFKDQFSRESIKGISPDKLDFDSPDTLDTAELNRFIDEIFSKGRSRKPVFDFVKGERSRYEESELDEDDVLMLEGIQVLYPDVLSTIEAHGGSVMCVCPMSGIRVNERYFHPDLIRLLRRLVRDSNFRGASPEFTMGIWEGVRRNEDLNIFPHMNKCQVQIDTTLSYELNILAPYLRELLTKLKIEDRHYAKGMEILEMIEGIEGIESNVLTPKSLYREFV